MIKYFKWLKIYTFMPFIAIAISSCQSVNKNQIIITPEDRAIINEYTRSCAILETKINRHISNARQMIAFDEVGKVNGDVNILNLNLNDIEKNIQLSCSSKKNLNNILTALGESLADYGKSIGRILRNRKFIGSKGRATLIRYRDNAKDMSEFSGDFVTLMEAAPPYISLLRKKGDGLISN